MIVTPSLPRQDVRAQVDAAGQDAFALDKARAQSTSSIDRLRKVVSRFDALIFSAKASRSVEAPVDCGPINMPYPPDSLADLTTNLSRLDEDVIRVLSRPRRNTSGTDGSKRVLAEIVANNVRARTYK